MSRTGMADLIADLVLLTGSGDTDRRGMMRWVGTGKLY